MTRVGAMIGAVGCLALGALDLGVMNLYLGPRVLASRAHVAGGDDGEDLVSRAASPRAPAPSMDVSPNVAPAAASPAASPAAHLEPLSEPDTAPPEPDMAPPEPDTAPPEPDMAPPEPVSPPAVSPPPAAPLPPPAVVQFDTASADLTGQAAATLAAAAARLPSLPGARVQIVGHADRRGEQAFNRMLSKRRALAVLAHLRGRGVPRGRLVVSWRGSSTPRDRGDTPGAHASNRRVELHFISRTDKAKP